MQSGNFGREILAATRGIGQDLCFGDVVYLGGAMKVFLSWSGETSKAAAEAFYEWLPFVIHSAEPWVSSKNLKAGERWSPELWSQLDSTNFGVLFVTRSNQTEPWLLFEAGLLAKTTKEFARVCPYVLQGMTASDVNPGPLTQLQIKTSDKAGTFSLLESINDAMAEAAWPADKLARSFEKWWPELEAKLSALPPEATTVPPKRNSDEMIEEILGLTRAIHASSNSANRNPRLQMPVTFRSARKTGNLIGTDPLGNIVYNGKAEDATDWIEKYIRSDKEWNPFSFIAPLTEADLADKPTPFHPTDPNP
jgi:hypothetical protein